MKQALGIRVHNPLNIRVSKSAWQGKVQQPSQRVFEEFTSDFYGYRAAAKLLMRYYREYKLQTIAQIISRWAPESENNTAVYVQTVSDFMGWDAGKRLPEPSENKSVWILLVMGMARVEVGEIPSPQVIAKAILQ